MNNLTLTRKLSFPGFPETRPVPEPEPPPEQPGSDPLKQYCVVLHDHEHLFNAAGEGICRLEGPPYGPDGNGWPLLPEAPNAPQGLPETAPLFDTTYVKMTEKIQWYWFGLLQRNAPPEMTLEQLKKAWANLTHGARAFTNRKGWNDGYADYINGINLDVGPMEMQPIVTGGNVLEVLSGLVSKGGRPHYQVKVLTAAEITTPELLNHETRPEVIFHATVTRRERLEDGTRRVNSFPQLQGRDVPVPLISKTAINYIRAEYVRLLPRGAPFPNPYNPAR